MTPEDKVEHAAELAYRTACSQVIEDGEEFVAWPDIPERAKSDWREIVTVVREALSSTATEPASD